MPRENRLPPADAAVPLTAPPVAGAPAGSLAPAATPAAPASAGARPAMDFAQLPHPGRVMAEVWARMACHDDEDFEGGAGPEALQAVNRATAAFVARATGGFSPAALALAYMD